MFIFRFLEISKFKLSKGVSLSYRTKLYLPDLTVTPGLIEATKKATTFFAPQVLKQNVSPLNIEFLGDFYIYRQFRKNDDSHL